MSQKITIITPQFERVDGMKIDTIPSTPEQFDSLKTLDDEALHELGMQEWGEYNLWLFPKEWYNHIPDGYEVTIISGKKEKFKKGVTDDDIRFGMLAYGICVAR